MMPPGQEESERGSENVSGANPLTFFLSRSRCSVPLLAPLHQLDPPGSGLDIDLPPPIANAAGHVIPGVPSDGNLEVGLDVAARGLDVHLGADGGRDLERDVARARLHGYAPQLTTHVRCDRTASGLQL